MELRGSLKTDKKPLSNEELDEVVAQAVADDWAETLKRMKWSKAELITLNKKLEKLK